MSVAKREVVLPSVLGFLFAPIVDEPFLGFYTIVWYVARYSSETSVIPDSVTCILHAGIVSPCFHGIHVQITAVSTQAIVIPTLANHSRLLD